MALEGVQALVSFKRVKSWTKYLCGQTGFLIRLISYCFWLMTFDLALFFINRYQNYLFIFLQNLFEVWKYWNENIVVIQITISGHYVFKLTIGMPFFVRFVSFYIKYLTSHNLDFIPDELINTYNIYQHRFKYWF